MADKAQLNQYLESKNMAEDMDTHDLVAIGIKIIDWFDEDEASRKPWTERTQGWLKLATQVIENKSFPWPGAANVKFPLLTTASMQFAARAYPALVPGPNLVQGLVIGRDEGGFKQEIAQRIGRHMSYQLLYQMDGWEEDMDRLCLMLPILGCLFKKTYFDPVKGKNVSDLVLPTDLVIDYYAKTVETATRKGHIVYLTKNDVQERINRGLYLDIDLGEPRTEDPREAQNAIDGTLEPKVTPATPYKLIECHCWWDFDDDGYDEPYIITVDHTTKQVLRIVARFEADGIETELDEKGKEKIVRIKPLEYFTKFGFIPNPDGSIYDLGFGLLLGGINESVNTLTNQLLDSGTLNNLQAGYLGRGIRIRTGNSRFLPGEWKPVDFTGDDIKKHIFPLPTKEPSDVLFKLLEALVTSGKELASVAEIFVGKMPGQNTPATTTMATIEQGLKVFTAIYKRVYRSLGQEYQKLFKLNQKYVDGKVYFTINEPEGPQSQEVSQTDYQNDLLVKPNADPNIVSSAQKLMKVQSYGSLLQLGTIQPLEYTKRYLEAVEAENIQALINTQPPPNPEAQKMQAEMQMKQQDQQMKMQLEQMKAAMDRQSHEMDMRFKMMEMQLKEREMQMEMMHTTKMHEMELTQTAQSNAVDLELQKQSAGQKLQQQDEAHKQKLTQQKQTQDAKPKAGSGQ